MIDYLLTKGFNRTYRKSWSMTVNLSWFYQLICSHFEKHNDEEEDNDDKRQCVIKSPMSHELNKAQW